MSTHFSITLLVLFAVAAISLGSLQHDYIGTISKFNETSPILDIASKQTNEEVEVETQTPFLVSLPSNPSTGFLWRLNVKEMTGVLALDPEDSGEVVVSKSEAGAPATQLFSFLSRKAGSGRLSFVYSKSGESDENAGRYQMEVKIAERKSA